MPVNYVVPFKVNGLQIPIRTQVALARVYCAENQVQFTLPTSESWYDQSYNRLESQIHQGPSDIIVYSQLLLCHENCMNILKRNEHKIIRNEITFHITFNAKQLSYYSLVKEIKQKIRHNKYAKPLSSVLYSRGFT